MSLGSRLLTGQLPLSATRTFLHETTHHWCFDSAVGITIATLWQRIDVSLRECFKKKCDTDRHLDIVEELCRYRAAFDILRPLSEGLALFAEFDALPEDESNVPPFLLTGALFARDEIQREGYVKGMQNLLATVRLDVELDGIQDKEKLLREPFGTERGGYFEGYLAIKQAWHQLRSRDQRLWNGSSFMALVRDFIFEDTGFVETILDDSPLNGKDSIARVLPIASYFEMRWKALLKLEGAALDAALRSVMHTDQSRVKTPNKPYDGFLLGREFVTLASKVYPISKTVSGVVNVGKLPNPEGPFDGHNFCSMPAINDEPLPPGATGELSFVVSVASAIALFAVHHNGRVVAAKALNRSLTEEERSIVDSLGTKCDCVRLEEHRDLLERFNDELGMLGFTADIKILTRKLTDVLYLHLAFLTEDQAQIDDILSAGSLESLLPDPVELRVLTVVGLCGSMRLPQELPKCLPSEGYKDEDFLEIVQRVSEKLKCRTGLRIIAAQRGKNEAIIAHSLL